MTTTVKTNTAPPGRAQRSIKNYLLDPGFQLKYSGYLVAIALLLSGALGTLLYKTSNDSIQQSHTAVTNGQTAVNQAREAVSAGQELIKKSQDLSNVVKMNIAEKYADQPELAKLFSDEAKKKDAELLERQKRFEGEADRLKSEANKLAAQATALEAQQRTLMATLIAVLSTLVIFIGAAGIVITHKIAGPVFKMKRQIRDLSDGHLRIPSPLRKGDELVDLFKTFETMVTSLRSRQEVEISKLDAIISDLERSNASPSTLKALQTLRADMQAELE